MSFKFENDNENENLEINLESLEKKGCTEIKLAYIMLLS